MMGLETLKELRPRLLILDPFVWLYRPVDLGPRLQSVVNETNRP